MDTMNGTNGIGMDGASGAPDRTAFSEQDRLCFAEYKAAIRDHLRKSRPDSEIIHRNARRLVEIRERGYHRLDGIDDPGRWVQVTFGMSEHQLNKYLKIATLDPGEVRGKSQGVESLYQIYLTPLALREAIWQLAENERLTEGALTAGRLVALGFLARGQVAKARQVMVSKARQWAEDEGRDKAAQQRRSQRAPLERAAERLERGVAGLEQALDSEQELPAQRVDEVKRLIHRLNELAERLDSRVGGPAQGSATATAETRASTPPASAAEQTSRNSAADADIGLFRTSATSETAQPPANPNPPGEPPRTDANPPAATAQPPAEPPKPSTQDDQPADVAEFAPILDFARTQLPLRRRECIRELLFQIAANEVDPELLLDDLKKISAVCKFPVPESLLARWFAQLRHPRWETRGLFAARCLFASRLPTYSFSLAELATYPLPASLRQEVDRLRDQIPDDDLEAEDEALCDIAVSDEMDQDPFADPPLAAKGVPPSGSNPTG